MTHTGVPTVTIGHLDHEGVDILDRKLKENLSIEEIIAFFSNYKPKLLQLKVFKSKSNMETTSEEFSTTESFTLEIENNTEAEILDQNQTRDQCVNAITLNSVTLEIEKEKEVGRNGTSSVNDLNDMPDITVSTVDVQTKQKENSEKETKENRKSVRKKRNIFDVLDVEMLKKNIPFMHPDRKTHTFRFLHYFLFIKPRTLSRYFFDRVHEVCGSLGLGEKMKMTEKEMLDVEQLRMGGSYLQEMKQLRAEGADSERIEKYFLQKDLQAELEERRRSEREVRMKEKAGEVRCEVGQL